jgi:hypothetical protein
MAVNIFTLKTIQQKKLLCDDLILIICDIFLNVKLRCVKAPRFFVLFCLCGVVQSCYVF